MFWVICTSIARLTKQPNLVPDISSKSVPFVPSRGECQNTFQIERTNLKDFSSLHPTALYKRDGFTGNVWYKIRLLSQPSNTRTNNPKHASGPTKLTNTEVQAIQTSPPPNTINTTITLSRVQEPYRGRARFFQKLIFYEVTRPKLMILMWNFKGFPMP